MITLQEMQLFDKGYCAKDMLYRCGNEVVIENGSLSFKNEISFDTYFNMFSSDKWRAYTRILTVSFDISIQGNGKIEFIIGSRKDGEEYVIKNVEYNCDRIMPIVVLENFPVADMKDYCYVRIISNGYTSIYNGKYYSNDAVVPDKLKYACGICTFKREVDLENNLNTLIEDILENEQSPLYNLIDVYISDNGKTLPLKKWEKYPSIHISYNKNYGGSAGFTRTMIESGIYNDNTLYNYIILMDDDILLWPTVLIRLNCFARVLKSEFKNNIIGGANLDLHKRNIQTETCGFYNAINGRNIITKQNGLNLSIKENVIFNDADVSTNFSGWWFSCIPNDIISEKNLPLPLFIHRDDQEYGARNGKEAIGLNGICIWHPRTSGKHPDYLWYYESRNMLIASMSLCPDKMTTIQIKKDVLRMVLSSCLAYRYGKAEMILRGYEEFLNGVNNFKKLDPEKNHLNLIASSKRDWFIIEKSDLVKIKRKTDEDTIPVLIRVLRYFLPSFGKCYVEDECTPSAYIGKRKVVVVNMETKKSYFLEKNWGKTITIIKKMVAIMRKFDKNYTCLKKEWIEAVREFKTIDFWKDYLEI